MLSRLLQLWRDEDAVTTLEFALLLAILAALGVTNFGKIGSLASDSITKSKNAMSNEQTQLWRQAASAGHLR